MDMRDRLPPVGTDVQNRSVSVIGDALGAGEVPRREEHPAQEVGMVVVGGVQGRDVLAGNHENVDRCLRVDVAKGHQLVIFMDEGRRDLASRDFAEQAI